MLIVYDLSVITGKDKLILCHINPNHTTVYKNDNP